MFLERDVLVIRVMPNLMTELLLPQLDNWLFTEVGPTCHHDLLTCYQV